MKARLKSWLQKFKIGGQPLGKDLLVGWLVGILTGLFGRDVEIANGQTQRVFPVVWGKKIHLLGLQHRLVEASFSAEYTLRLHTRPPVALSPGTVTPPVAAAPTAVHLVLGHLPAEPMNQLLEYMQELAGATPVILTYGGKQEEFDQIRFPRKVFIADPCLRGTWYKFTYFNLMTDARAYLTSLGLDPDWIFISDYDLLPLKPNYLDGLIALMQEHGAGLGGKLFEDVTDTNKSFVTQAVRAGIIDKTSRLNGPGKSPVYHCIGCAFLAHRDCYNAILEERPDLAEMYFELVLPTAAALRGYRLLSFDLFSKCFEMVRYRPVFLPTDAAPAAAAGADFIHPLKEPKLFIDARSTRRTAEAASPA